MCRGKKVCTELGAQEAWDDYAPLPPPSWIRAQFPLLKTAFAAAARGDVAAAVEAITAFPDSEVRQWCIEHGQGSGRVRHRMLGEPGPNESGHPVGPRAPRRGLAVRVFERDRYQCRYCGLHVVPRELFVAFGSVVGKDRFPTERENSRRHGARLAFGAQLDHVMPYSAGGQTALDNIVTACWSCNFGKTRFQVEQIGIIDPRMRPPSPEQWDGFVPLLGRLREVARRAAI